MRFPFRPILTVGIAVCAMPCAPASAASFSVIGSVSGGPQIGAVQGDLLYGTIKYQGDGVLFSLTTAGTYTLLHDFTAATDGSAPNARLALDKAGNLYGTASGGGANSGGTLWEYTAAGTMQTPHAFGANGDGTVPMQGPTLGSKGAVYGATGEGAIGGSGNLFRLNRAGSYDVMYEFMSGADGHCPFSGVAFGKDGTLYGTTVGVGFGGNPTGSVWSYSAAGVLTTLYVFQDGDDGEWPDQSPVVDSKGNVYGTTHVQNGNGFAGAIWKITASGQFSVLHDMNGAVDGYGPNSPLVIGPRGTLYGTTGSGGASNDGTVFSITEDGAFKVVHSFGGGSDGASPTGNLVRGSNGILFGGTSTGPVFAISP
jgi:uncharacterized repeat protein (TIGR03803 family)